MSAPSWAEYYDDGKAEAITRRPDLTFDEGDISDMFMSAAAAMADLLTGYAAGRFRASYLDGARGDDLTTLCNDHWGVVRNPSVAASGTVTISRAAYTNGAGSVSSGSIVTTNKDALGNDIQYALDTDATFGATDLTVDVNVTAVLTGAFTNAATATVLNFVVTPFDSTLAVTNASPMAGGEDAESDEALRDRTRALPSILRRGTLDALEYGATQVAGVVTAHAVESATGIVTVFVADVDGNSNGTMVDDVQDELENWRAAGALVYASGGTLYDGAGTSGAGRLIVTMSLTVKTGVDVNVLISNIKAAVVARLSKLKPGEICRRSAIITAVMNTAPTDILEVDLTAPAVDLQPSSNELVRTTSADITVT